MLDIILCCSGCILRTIYSVGIQVLHTLTVGILRGTTPMKENLVIFSKLTLHFLFHPEISLLRTCSKNVLSKGMKRMNMITHCTTILYYYFTNTEILKITPKHQYVTVKVCCIHTMENYAAEKRNEEYIYILLYLRIYNYMKNQGGINSVWDAIIYLRNYINYIKMFTVYREREHRVEETGKKQCL